MMTSSTSGCADDAFELDRAAEHGQPEDLLPRETRIVVEEAL